jgi:hypothetical protein
VKKFRVISTAEVLAMIENKEFPKIHQECVPAKDQSSNEKNSASGKKRDREEAFGAYSH